MLGVTADYGLFMSGFRGLCIIQFVEFFFFLGQESER